MPTKSTPARTNNRQLIFTIYVYFFIGLGLILTCVGTYGLAQNIFNRVLLPKYPLGYNETRCDYLRYDANMPKPIDTSFPAPNPEQMEIQYQDCVTKLEEERQVKMATDLSNSLIILIIGASLFGGHVWVNTRAKQ